jgi:predicted phosphodiesterase
MRLAWATDIHLNFLPPERIAAFGQVVARSGADALVISGDIAEAPTFEANLEGLARAMRSPIYFVLGNHDYYRGAIADVRARAEALSGRVEHLHWLPAAGIVPLTERTALVGHDGWADGRLGDYARSTVLLNDYFLIEDLAGLDEADRLLMLQMLGDESADWATPILERAFARFHRVILATHAPPFLESCQYEGGTCNDDWLPHIANHALGAALLRVMHKRRGRSLTVLCGHTHGEAAVWVRPNLHVRTGGAEYGRPRIQGLLEVP